MAAQLAFASDYMEGAHPAILKKVSGDKSDKKCRIRTG